MLLAQKKNRATKAARLTLDDFAGCTLDDMHAAIRAVLFESPERLEIRHLWTRGAISYFRVNRWSAAISGGPRILRSSFVLVEALDCGWRVQERNEPGRRAAPPMVTRERQVA